MSVEGSTVSRALPLAGRRASEPERTVVVAQKQMIAEGVVSLTLEPLANEILPSWTPGAHIDVVLGDAGTRQYSLCGDPADPTWRLGVALATSGGGASAYIHDEVSVGQLLRVRGPRNTFELVTANRYLFVGGGVGITPLLPMIRTVEAAGAEWRLAYAGRSTRSMAFRDELADYDARRVTIWAGDRARRLDVGVLLEETAPETMIYCCGPAGLMEAVERVSAKRPKGSVRLERFSPASPADLGDASEFEVHLAQTGVTLTVPKESSVLAVVERTGVPVLSSCLVGTCGTCETNVLAGVIDHRDSVLDADERAANDRMMICVSRACSSRLVLDL